MMFFGCLENFTFRTGLIKIKKHYDDDDDDEK